MLGTKTDSLRRAIDRGLVTPSMARDAFTSMVASTRAQNAAIGTDPADTPPQRDGLTVEYKPARTTSPDRDRFERKYGSRPLPANKADRPRRKWLGRTLYFLATLIMLAAAGVTLWQFYGE